MLRKKTLPHKKIHLFLTGGAGTGKTFLLMLLIQGLLRHYTKTLDSNIDTPIALVMAYTGKVTFNVGGTTIHSALLLPLVSQKIGLSSKKLDTLTTHYRNQKIIVIDEISLVGA